MFKVTNFLILGNSEVVLVKKPQNSTEKEDCLDSWTSNINEACPNVFTGNGLIYLCGCNQTLAQVGCSTFLHFIIFLMNRFNSPAPLPPSLLKFSQVNILPAQIPMMLNFGMRVRG